MSSKVLGFAAAISMGLALPVWAHHSHVNYEPSDTVTVSGTITEIQWINPHTWVFINVEDENGQMQEWALESGSPNQLSRRGWRPEEMQPGDTITAIIRPLRGGATGGLLGTIILADGTRFCDPYDAAPLGALCEE